MKNVQPRNPGKHTVTIETFWERLLDSRSKPRSKQAHFITQKQKVATTQNGLAFNRVKFCHLVINFIWENFHQGPSYSQKQYITNKTIEF